MKAFTGTGPTSRRLEHRFKGDNVYRKNRSARLALHTDGMHGHHALARDMLSMRTRSWSSHPRSTGLQIVQSHAQQDFADSPTYQDLNNLGAQVAGLLKGSSVYLVGMMGSGKSAAGQKLSTALSYCFFDTDDMIVALSGKSIADIFREEGEEAFRTTETAVIQELAPYRNCVVSTGGGAVLRAQNWADMQTGVVVWLRGTPELLAQRVVGDGTQSRPLLAGEQGADEQGDALQAAVAKLEGLMKARQALYEQADIVIPLDSPGSSTGASLEEVVWRMLCALRDRLRDDAASKPTPPLQQDHSGMSSRELQAEE
ncbi:SHKF1 [Auxenochlorella protothecoides x Auxenochlorella symbiontica]